MCSSHTHTSGRTLTNQKVVRKSLKNALRSERHALSRKAKNEQAACITKKKSKKDYYLNVKDVFDCGWLFSIGGKGITKDSLGYLSLEKKDT